LSLVEDCWGVIGRRLRGSRWRDRELFVHVKLQNGLKSIYVCGLSESVMYLGNAVQFSHYQCSSSLSFNLPVNSTRKRDVDNPPDL
jgi:hypothetical protein